MRKSGTFLVVSAWALMVGCAPSAQHSDSPSVMRGSTGYFDKADGVDYISTDPYVIARMNEEPTTPASNPKKPNAKKPDPKTPAQPLPVPAANNLTDRLRQFEISRFNNGSEFKQPVRFGTDAYKMIVFFKREAPVTFEGKLKAQDGKFHVESTVENYSIVGDLSDSAPDKTTAVFRLTDLKTKDVVEISYNAYKAKLTVHEDVETPVPAGSSLRQQIDSLKTNSFGWVNNWTVLNGPSFYLVDMIKIIDGKTASSIAPYTPALAFEGESKRTATEDQSFEWDAKSLTPDAAPKVVMIGNSEEGNGRAFQVTLEDKNSRQTSDVIVDVEPENPEFLPIPLPDETPSVDTSAPAPDDGSGDPDVSSIPIPTPAPDRPSTPAKPATPKVPQVSGSAYLPINMSLSRTARMHRDYARTLNLRGVQAAITRWQNGPNGKGKSRTDLQNFFDRAYPFRAFVQAVSNAFDSNPMWMYLTVDESNYFTGSGSSKGGRTFYQVVFGDNGAALGPFQLHVPAAKDGKVKSLSNSGAADERRFVAPSACGAARYLAQQSDAFAKSGDTVLGIAGYNQGTGGARKYTQKYNYTWSSVDRFNAGASQHMINYVNSKLAIYFIANNRQYYRFPVVSGNEVKNYPSNNSLMPPAPISEAKCRAIAERFFGAGT